METVKGGKYRQETVPMYTPFILTSNSTLAESDS